MQICERKEKLVVNNNFKKVILFVEENVVDDTAPPVDGVVNYILSIEHEK